MKLNAQQLRELEEKKATGTLRNIRRNPIFFILENVYDTYNIGGLFRLADALAIEKIYLCGDTEIPPNHRIKKASIGTYKVVDWEYRKSAKEAITELISSQYSVVSQNNKLKLKTVNRKPITIVAVEQTSNSTDYRKTDYRLPLALIFGNESYGITEETLKLADQIVEIPMWGINKSLNVIVSAAIVSYWAMGKIKQ